MKWTDQRAALARHQGARQGRLRALMGLLAGAACLWLAMRAVEPGALGRVPGMIADLAPSQWLAALCGTLVSYWALGRYDGVAHRHLGTLVDLRRAEGAGAAAIAISQTAGFGLITGALARWRLLPGLSPAQAIRVTLFVALSFMAALAVVTAAAGLLMGGPLPRWLCALGLLMALAAAAMAFRWPVLHLGGRQLGLPSLAACGRILGMTLLDTLAAAFAFFALAPPDLGLDLATLYPVFLLALGAGLLAGTPGGVGAFDLALIGLLPQVPDAPLLATLAAYRLVYFALPAALALIALARPGRLPAAPAARLRDVTEARAGDFPETGALRQNRGSLVDHGAGVVALVPLGQSLVMLGDPVEGPIPLGWLRDSAAAAARTPCLYKTGPRGARAARRAGWDVVRIAEEALIDPARHDLSRPACRGLRRKLRRAASAGLVIQEAVGPVPLAELEGINRAWRTAHGYERGFSMGRFSAELVARQRVLLARQEGRLVAFVTFHESALGLTLDLMRARPEAPDGTMHALVQRAIEDAAAQGLPRVSLAAVPPRAGATRLARLINAAAGAGLARFKEAFAPQWRPLYAAAPGRAALGVALADIARAVHRPGPLPQMPNAAHESHENFGFASEPAS